MADVGRQVPQCIVVTAMRPGMVLYSDWERIICFIELTIPFEEAIEEAFERKEQYAELEADARGQGWQAHTKPEETGGRGSVAKPTPTLLVDAHSKELYRSCIGSVKDL